MNEILKRLKTRAVLAPMAGYTDSAFRTLCMEYGAAYCVTEMVSAKGLVQGNKTAWELQAITTQEVPCAAQLFSDDADSMEKAVYKIGEASGEQCSPLQSAARPFIIDINCGCPAKKIVGNGGGAALMKNPEKAAEICKVVVKAANVPVSVKFRLGWDDDSRNAVEFAKRMEGAGASLLTVHGRTRAQMYAPPVDLESIAAVKRAVSVPVIANGDVIDGITAKHALEVTGCDGVMVGRGSLGRPWGFAQIAAYLERGEILPEPEAVERGAILLRHVRMLCEKNGEMAGMRQARKTAAHYFKGLRGAADFRVRAVRINTFSELKTLVDEVLINS